MKHRPSVSPYFLPCLLGLILVLAVVLSSGQAALARRPNILLITGDDLNCDSIGAFGCRLADTSPNVDRLAKQGLRFDCAHVQVANCMPSRNVLLSGRYPHKPFYGQARNGDTMPDPNVPSRVFKPEEVPVPGFLPDDAVVRKELAHYYSSVRRGDDCVGQVLQALKDSGEEENTVVIFLSDHGMPLPFAKTQMYHHSTHTPWIVRWPGVTKAGEVDKQHMISAVDFLPTILDITGIKHPEGLDGRSFLPLLKGQSQSGRDMVFKEYNENSGGSRNPMRAVQTRTHLYIFNPWSNGKRLMATATNGTPTWRRMKELARTNPQVAARVELMEHRVPEEAYHVSRDPDALKNLISDSGSQAEIQRLRGALESWMVKTRDPMLDVFRQRADPAAREAYMAQVEKEAAARGGRRGRRNAPNDGD